MHFKLLFVTMLEQIFSLYTLDQITNNGAPVLAFAKHIPIILDNLVNPAIPKIWDIFGRNLSTQFVTENPLFLDQIKASVSSCD